MSNYSDKACKHQVRLHMEYLAVTIRITAAEEAEYEGKNNTGDKNGLS